MYVRMAVYVCVYVCIACLCVSVRESGLFEHKQPAPSVPRPPPPSYLPRNQVQKDNPGIGEDEFYLACEMARRCVRVRAHVRVRASVRVRVQAWWAAASCRAHTLWRR